MGVFLSYERDRDVAEVVNKVGATSRDPKRQQKTRVAIEADSEFAEFGLCMSKVEMAKVELETCKLAFEQRRQEEIIEMRTPKTARSSPQTTKQTRPKI